MSAPIPPLDPIEGVPGPTYVAHDGHVWRRAMHGWTTVDQPLRLMEIYRDDALDTTDWWHKRAAELADEIEAAMRDLNPERKAA